MNKAIQGTDKIFYGRSTELKLLESHFDHVLQGSFTSCIISGEAGVGKTHLLSYLATQLRSKHAKYIYAKYDHYNAGALKIIGTIVQQLVDIILMGSEQELQEIKSLFNEKSGSKVSIISTICKDAEILVGTYDTVMVESYHKHEYLYHKAFFNFISIISHKISPLIIHIDDFQWADEASINIINRISEYKQSLSTFLVFSLRNEKENLNILKLISQFTTSNHPHIHIQLKRLGYKESINYLKDHFDASLENESYTLDKLFQATMGNPYYMERLVETICIHSDEFFNNDTGKWCIPDTMLNEFKISDNIVQPIINQFFISSPEIKYMLQVLACLGISVDQQLVDALFSNQIQDYQTKLDYLCFEGMLIKKIPIRNNEIVSYKLSHDLILDTIHEQITPSNKLEIHYRITKVLCKLITDLSNNHYILLAAKHITKCQQHLSKKKELDIYINILHKAGIIYKENTMVKDAYFYFRCCLEMLKSRNHSYDIQYIQTISILFAESAFIHGDIDESVKIFNKLLIEVDTKDKKILLMRKMILLYTSIAEGDKVMLLSKEILSKRGIRLNTSHIHLKMIIEIFRFKFLFTQKRITQVQSINENQNPIVEEISEIFIRMIGVSNLSNDDDLFILLLLRLSNYSLKWGTTEHSIPAYLAGSFILNSVLNEKTLAISLSSNAENLLRNAKNKGVLCMSHFILGSFIKHWFEHVSVSVDYLMKAVDYGLDAGDLQYAEYSYCSMLEIVFITGVPIKNVRYYINKINDYDARLKNDVLSITVDMLENHLSRLEGNDHNPSIINRILSSDPMQLVTYYYYELQIAFLVDDKEKCAHLLNLLQKYKDPFKGYFNEVDYIFYTTMVRLTLHRTFSGFDRILNTVIIKKAIRQFNRWIRHSKQNHWGRYNILQAKYNEVFSLKSDIDKLYEEAITFSNLNNHFALAAVGNLMMANYYKSNKRIASLYITHALDAIYKWGADGIAEIISHREQIFLNKEMDQGIKEDMITEYVPNTPKTIQNTRIKMNTKSFESLDMDQSMIHMLEYLCNNTRHVYGAIFVAENAHYFLTHEFINHSAQKVKKPIVLDQVNHIALNLVRYVSRTKSELVIQNKSAAGFFDYDPHLSKLDCYSVLCAPILYADILVGIIYLEAEEDSQFSEETLSTIHRFASLLAVKRLAMKQGLSKKNPDKLPLTQRELEVFKYIIKGHTNKEVGALLHISLSTVKTHLINIYSKLEIKNRVEAVEKAKEYGLD